MPLSLSVALSNLCSTLKNFTRCSKHDGMLELARFDRLIESWSFAYYGPLDRPYLGIYCSSYHHECIETYKSIIEVLDLPNQRF